MKKYRLLSILLTAVLTLSYCSQGIAAAAEADDGTEPSFSTEEKEEPETEESEEEKPSDKEEPEPEESEEEKPSDKEEKSEPEEKWYSEDGSEIERYSEDSSKWGKYAGDEEDPFADYPYDKPYADPNGGDYYDEDEPFADYPYDEPFANPYKEDPYDDPYYKEDPYDPFEYLYPYYHWSDPDADRRCGDKITWDIKDDTLILSGSGAMWTKEEWQEKEMYDDIVPWMPYAFNVSYLVIEEGITEIGEDAFFSNDKIEKVSLPSTLEKIGNCAFQDCICLNKLTLPENLKEIGANAFERTGLEIVDIPETVTKLNDAAFSEMQNLVTVNLPDTLTYIGEECFSECPKLINITIPDSVSFIGKGILDGCVEWFHHQTSDFAILGDGFLYKYLGESANIQIPESVKHICANAFTEQVEEEIYSWYSDSYSYLRHVPRQDIEMIVIPDTVEELPAGCFQSLSGLQQVILPETLRTIPAHAFAYCTALDHVLLPDSLETIEHNAFSNCDVLSDILIPETVTFVGRDAFKGTEFLKKFGEYAIVGDGLLVAYRGKDSVLHLPEGIKAICSEAINAENITEITFPSTLRRVLDNGVRSRSLVKVNMNEGLEEIGYYGIVFSDACKSYRLPDSVKLLEEDSIRANSLKVIYGSEESKAKEYASKRGVEFKTEEIQKTGPDMTLNLKKDVWCFGNNGENFDNEYYLTDRDREIVEGFINPRAKAFPDKWSGDCFGLALTVILAKNGMLPANAFQRGAKNLHDLKPSKNVQSLINYYHCVQYSDVYIRANLTESKAQRFYRMIQTAERISEGESPFLLSFQTAEFAHAVVGYGVEHGSWEYGGRKYDSRILIWDPNFSGYLAEDACLYYDKISFSYCIPHYDIYVDRLQGSIGILQVVNDLSILNANPYPYDDSAVPKYEQGDVNGDGQVTVADAVMLARIAAEDTTLKCDDRMTERADVDKSGGVTIIDCTLLLKMLAQTKTE